MDHSSQRFDLASWRDFVFGALGMVCIVAGVGHFLDWLKDRRPGDWKMTLGFSTVYAAIFILSPRRYYFAIVSLLAVVACGALNTVLLQTQTGLWIIVPCALLAYLLLRWKGNLLK